MTVATRFDNWQAAPRAQLANHSQPAPALVSLRTYVLDAFGGADLGIFGVRDTRSGGNLSSHAFGAAWDWSYRGKGDAHGLVVGQWMIDNSAELGVQAVHDYLRCRIWRANRSGDINRGWKPQAPSATSGMGQAWADWLHVEVNAAAWHDGRPVAVKLGVAVAGPGTPPLDERPTLRRGDVRPEVRVVQQILADRAGQPIEVDGRFGTQTEMAVRNVQAFCRLPVTGVVDGAFWHVIDVLLGAA